MSWYFTVVAPQYPCPRFIQAAGDNLLEAFKVAKGRMLPGEVMLRFSISKSSYQWSRMKFGVQFGGLRNG